MVGFAKPEEDPKMSQQAPAPKRDEPQADMEKPGPMADETSDGEQQASPEEQAIYDRLVAKGVMLMTEEAVLPKLIKTMKGFNNPQQGLAVVAANLVIRVRDDAEKNGQKVPPDVLYSAGEEIFENLADLASQPDAEFYDFTKDPEAMEGAWYRAVDYFRTQTGGGDKKAMQDDMRALVEADKNGQLADLLGADPTQAMQAMQGGGKPAGPGAQQQPPAPARGMMPRGM